MHCTEDLNYNSSATIRLSSKLMVNEKQKHALPFRATTTIMPKQCANQHITTKSELNQMWNCMSNKYKSLSANKCTEFASVSVVTAEVTLGVNKVSSFPVLGCFVAMALWVAEHCFLCILTHYLKVKTYMVTSLTVPAYLNYLNLNLPRTTFSQHMWSVTLSKQPNTLLLHVLRCSSHQQMATLCSACFSD